MADKPQNPFHLWNELKQRKVVQVITVYTASALAVLQAVDMIFPRLGFPSWTVTLIMILLGCGLIIAIILSWIYDITPEGIKKTEDLQQISDEIDSNVRYVVPQGKPGDVKSHDKEVTYSYELYADKIQHFKQKGKIYSYGSVVVILAVIVLFTFSSANTVPFAERDWIVIADFENLTQNPVFDKSLYTAFSLTASQSRYINILPRGRMLETMKRMEIRDREYVDEKTGREIAIREGIDIYIVPNISEVGNRYVIAAKIMETRTGNLLRSDLVETDSQTEILGKLDLLSKKIRRHLGESRYRIASQDKPLQQVTTSSLEALKLFSLGIDRQVNLDFTAAKGFFENALKIDTGFTAARASLGNLVFEKFDQEKGRELLKQAVKSVEKLTERERLGILAFHSISVENNIPKAIEYAKMRIELYPDDAAVRNNLGWYYYISGQFEEAAQQYKAVVRTFPDMLLSYSGIERIYLEKLGIIDSAIVWGENLVSNNPDTPWGYFYLASAWFCYDSLEKARHLFLKAHEISPKNIMFLYRLAHTCRTMGQNKEAIEYLEKVLKIDETEYAAYSDIGINYLAMGNKTEGMKYLLKFKKYATGIWLEQWPDMSITYSTIASVTARLNEMDSSRLMLQKAMAIDSTQYIDFASVLCLQGDIPGAIEQMEKALENGYRDLTWIKMHEAIQPMKDDPRFIKLLSRYFKL